VANNVVSMGTVSGTSESCSFWNYAQTTDISSLYGLNSSCAGCDGSVTLMTIDESDGQYYTIDEHTVVHPMLNAKAHDGGYSLRWDKEMKLRMPMVIHIGGEVNEEARVLKGYSYEENGLPDSLLKKYHLVPEGKTPTPANEYKKSTKFDEAVNLIPYHIVRISGEVSKTLYVEADGRRLGESVNDLKPYLKSKEYTVGDVEKNAILNSESSINEDMNIIVRKRNIVVIDIEGDVLAVDVNVSEIAESISALSGIELDDIMIDIEVDEQGYVIRVIVALKDSEMSDIVVKAVNELEKDSQCNSGILCQSRGARIEIDDLSCSHRIFSMIATIAMLAILAA